MGIIKIIKRKQIMEIDKGYLFWGQGEILTAPSNRRLNVPLRYTPLKIQGLGGVILWLIIAEKNQCIIFQSCYNFVASLLATRTLQRTTQNETPIAISFRCFILRTSERLGVFAICKNDLPQARALPAFSRQQPPAGRTFYSRRFSGEHVKYSALYFYSLKFLSFLL